VRTETSSDARHPSRRGLTSPAESRRDCERSSPGPDDHDVRRGDDVVRRIAALLDASGTLRRVLRARVRSAWPYDDLPVGQLDLLRLLVESPGLSVNQAAERLALAPNSVSTMVRGMIAAGLVERRSDPADARAARLYPSAHAAARLRRWRARRAQVLAAALPRLDGDHDWLDAAVAAVERLTAILAGDDETGVPDPADATAVARRPADRHGRRSASGGGKALPGGADEPRPASGSTSGRGKTHKIGRGTRLIDRDLPE